ncbi:MAG TPA: hypothetical protein VLF91_05655 [Candidatus Saccharimonadales bacterium]|nr:hypothetical protein [Candidatus Saccharimonadales bacterium]
MKQHANTPPTPNNFHDGLAADAPSLTPRERLLDAAATLGDWALHGLATAAEQPSRVVHAARAAGVQLVESATAGFLAFSLDQLTDDSV